MILIKLLPLWLTLSLITAATRPERRPRDSLNRPYWWQMALKAQWRKQWPKRANDYYSSCSCDEMYGMHDLGEGNYPQVVPSWKCGHDGHPRLLEVSRCTAQGEDIESVTCVQRTHPILVLRRRENPKGQILDNVPPEFQNRWEFVEVRVNSSCELARISDQPLPDLK